MATNSITKDYVVKDDKACEKLIKAMKNPVPSKVAESNYYEEGKKKLVQYFGH